MNPDAQAAIQVEELSRSFGDFTAVDRVSFQVQRGEIFGYLGANGAGKSTTIRMLCWLLAPSQGWAQVAGHDVAQQAEAVKRSIGYMSQKFSLYLDMTVQENFEFFGGAFGIGRKSLRRRIAQLMDELDIAKLGDSLCGALPGGWRQRVALASAMRHQPSILFLDEPTAGVDPVSRRDFWKIIRQLSDANTTIFVTTHYMDEAEYCHRVGLMVDGKLSALDSPGQLKRRFVPGRILMLKGLPRNLLPGLGETPGLLDLEAFGAGYHLRLDPEKGPGTEELAAQLRRAGASQLRIEEVSASLEDVFLKVVGESAKAAGEA